jgi:hypothetical protein
MVEDIEGIRPELEVDAFRNRKLSTYGEIDLYQSEAGNVISSLSSLADSRGCGEGRWIQTLAARRSGI